MERNRQKNRMHLEFDGIPINESFARSVVASFAISMNPTLEQLGDIKTAISEAVTNAIVHGYDGKPGIILIDGEIQGEELSLIIQDFGCGISDVEKARQPLYTTKSHLEHSGMGFTMMEVFMDEIKVMSRSGEGTCICMKKKIGSEN